MGEKSLQKRKYILETARKVFMEKGYKNVSIVDICKAANITKPTFYYYYDSKEDILGFISFEIKPDYSLLKTMTRLENPWQKLCYLGKAALEQLQLDYGREVIKAALSIDISREKKTFSLVTGALEELTLPLLEQCVERGIIRNHSEPKDILYYSNAMFVGLVSMWASNSLEGNVFEHLMKGMETIYDVNPAYRFPADLI